MYIRNANLSLNSPVCVGYLYLCGEGARHRGEAAVGGGRVERPRVPVRKLQEPGRIAPPGRHDQRDCLRYGGFTHDTQLPYE